MIKDTSVQDRAVTPKKRNILFGLNRTNLITLALIASIGAVSWISYPAVASLLSADATISNQQVRLAKVARGLFIEDIRIEGRTIAAVNPTLYSIEEGTVLLHVKAGDTVKKSQLLMVIDSPELRSEYAQEKARLDELSIQVQRQKIQTRRALLNNQQTMEIAGVDLAAAKSEMARSKASIDKSLISQLEYDEVVVRLKRAKLTNNHAIESLKLQKEQLEFELKALELQLQRQRHVSEELQRKVAALEIRSPLNGIVGNINIQQKQAVLRNTALLSLVDLSAFEVIAQIPESYADELGLGFEANITLNGKSYPGKLTAISPEVNNGQVAGRIRLIEQVSGMRQNQRVSAQIIIEKKENVLTLQRGAFVESGAGLKAYIVNKNLAKKVKIKLGARSTGKVEIISGLKEGDNVVISSLTPFQDQPQVLITQ
ncbi:efflux RND transporter periplasmic adaptor subunit [Pseudoalteromonas denitrificans]|uniref:HlyD family secretion protein n=1 Tax=Pseudoalteromonas denitrificans DSM 6059 TaxID=1123010 RepID=A0A1I1ELB3_9GAMM|nr:efflux RND transporter periplasmic adaptor subunit [Pseudoalteromonas denitrificans]SFB87884.1 HlyD family secretion protein [Pseudoalteromonas denitrificans DSM 6059]